MQSLRQLRLLLLQLPCLRRLVLPALLLHRRWLPQLQSLQPLRQTLRLSRFQLCQSPLQLPPTRSLLCQSLRPLHQSLPWPYQLLLQWRLTLSL